MTAIKQYVFDNVALPILVRDAIAFLKEHEPPEGYFLGFSGGKDSIATLQLAKVAGVKFVAGYSFTGIDHPEVVRMIKYQYPEVQFIFPKHSFWWYLRRNIPPLRKLRWCCSLLKESSSLKHKHLIMGIRAEESVARAKRGRINTHKGKTTYKPIFHWPEWAVWEFIEASHLVYPSLYDEGFPRIGCIVCPFIAGPSEAKKKLRALYQTRYPLIWKLHKKCVREWWKYRPPRPNDKFQNFEKFYENYWNT